jgi:hypothetical protein
MNWKDKNGKQVSRWKEYKGTTEKTCPVCGKSFSDFIANKRKYCSMKCYHKSPTRGTRPRNRRKETCDFCGKVFERPAANFKDTKHFFCSQPCFGGWLEKYGPHGADHQAWMGGYTQPKHTIGWHRAKKSALKRADMKCEKCGISGVLLDVHHLNPIRLCTDIKLINHNSNLQVLCRPCHMEADRILRGGHPHQKGLTVSYVPQISL